MSNIKNAKSWFGTQYFSKNLKTCIILKPILIIIGVLFVIFSVVQIFAFQTRNGIENYPFTVTKTYRDFEVRNYEASLFTSVKLSTEDYEEASSSGFSILAGYIFGGNENGEKIAMTSPVAMSLGDSMTVMFMVPKKIKKENLPKPDQPKIEFRDEPAKTVAAITFGGWANSKKIEKYKEQLIGVLQREGVKYTNRFYFLGYNPPFDFIGRKNEIVVELDDQKIN